MKILALDLGTRAGWALWDGERRESGVQVFDVKRGESPGMRYRRFSVWLDEQLSLMSSDALREERAWAAGFFDGEGCVGCYPVNDGGSTALVTQVPQVDRRVLDRFRLVVGVGQVGGPYEATGPNQNPIFRFRTTSLKDTRHVIETLWPWLSEVKRGQAAAALGDKLLAAKIPEKPRSDFQVVYEQTHQRGGAATEVAAGFATRVQEFCARHGIEHAAIHSATLKKWTTGRGNAKKPEMVAAVLRRFGIPARPGSGRSADEALDDNEADAIALLEYARAELVSAEAGR